MHQYTPFDSRLPFILCTAGIAPKQPPVARDPGPTWHQIIWITRGKGIFKIGEDTFNLSSGEGVFMKSDIPHSYSGDELSTSFVTFFCTESLITYYFGDDPYYIFKAPDYLEQALDELCRFAVSEASRAARSAAGYSFVIELFSAVTETTDALIERVRAYLSEHIAEPIQLDDVAANVGLDRYALCRYFASHHTCSVMNELKAMRISKAKQLLRYSSESIEHIGRLCGFESPSYFALRFREECGCSPLEYRKRRM